MGRIANRDGCDGSYLLSGNGGGLPSGNGGTLKSLKILRKVYGI